MKAKFYEGGLWKSDLENVLLPILEKYEVVLVEDSADLQFQQRLLRRLYVRSD